MNVKDHIQALVDEDLLRTEKIGTGNWYWIFGSDTRIQRSQTKNQLVTKVLVLQSRLDTFRDELFSARQSQIGCPEEEQAERTHHEDAIAATKREILELKTELGSLEMADPAAVQARREEMGRWKDEAEIWTENCYVLEGWMRERFSLGREEAGELLRGCYGAEWGEEEGGLVDLV
ncbi:MAG: hypothetical protein GOMPHAMPRED_001765 [Gomphillus americanus]|uniref:Mnd1 HTH domain-containing protein n=1 Tax=Gomphillus americanus TaxID=1940652 RepID=A0A8H3IL41_9LECA|nr:MAG: hypothetical protein GOMPHAMPRED_001765 [Gomphillus americanus]